MLRPFWQRKPVWLRVVLFWPLAVFEMGRAAIEGAHRYGEAVWHELPDLYDELLTTPRSDR